MSDKEVQKAMRARNVVWLMFDSPLFSPAMLIEAAKDFAPDLDRSDISSALVSLLNRGKLTLDDHGHVRRVDDAD